MWRLEIRRKLALFIVLIYAAPLWAATCEEVFPDAVSSNGASGDITFMFNSRVINSPDNILTTTNIVDNSGGVSCNTGACAESGSTSVTADFNSFPAASNITVTSGATLNLSPQAIGNLTVNFNAVLNLDPGDYTIRGDLTLVSQAAINVNGSGIVRLFVRDEIIINSSASINLTGTPEQLLLYSRNDPITLGANATVVGLVYTARDVTMSNGASIIGALSARDVDLISASTITYDQSAVQAADFGSFCTASVVVLPAPVAEWRFDELNWSGSAGEVVDNSGNNLNGQAISGASTEANTPAVSGSPGTCRYGSFDGATDYVTVADSAQLDITSALTVTAWIYPTALNSSLRTIVSKDENYEFHLNSTGQIFWWYQDSANNTRQITTTGTPLSLNQWHHVAIVYSSGAQKIYIDGIERAAASFVGTLRLNNDPLLIGTDIGFIGARNFIGAIDEVRVYNATLLAANIAEIIADTHSCVLPLDHYVISASANAVTCEPLTVAVSAVDGDGAAIDIPAGTQLTLSTDIANNGWTNLAGSGAIYTLPADAASVQYQLRRLTPGILEIDVDDNNGLTDDDGNRDDNVVTFADAAFRFVVDGVTGANISTKIAGKPSDQPIENQALQLKAIKTSDSDVDVCEALVVNSSVDIGFAYACDDPNSCAIGNDGLSINATAIDADSVGYTAVNLNFDANGISDAFTFSYDDAGLISLLVNADLVVSNTDPVGGVANVQGASNSFVVKPAGLCVAALPVPGDPACDPASASCSIYAKAGENFSLSVTAVSWQNDSETNADFCDNAITPNFQLNNIPLSSSVIAPVGGADGSLSVAQVAITSAGTVTQAMSQSEVGVFTFTATPPAYLGETLAASSSANIGRFTPHHFAVVAPQLIPADSTYTYLGQPLGVQMTIEARNLAGAVTSNYRDNFNKLTIETDLDFGAIDTVLPTLLTSRIALASPSFSWIAGAATITDYPLTINRNTVLEAPFTAVNIGVDFSDDDAITLLPGALNLDADNDAVNERLLLGVLNGELRYGRALVPPVYGPEVIESVTTTDIPFRVEYYDGSQFVLNVDDNQTRYGTGEVMLVDNGSGLSNYTGNLSVGETAVNNPNPSAVVINGVSSSNLFSIDRPGGGNEGTVDVSFPVESWLQFDWDNDGSDENPITTVHFGSYRGHDRIIFRREIQ
jgi:MSHA biogenesis protein MshQ